MRPTLERAVFLDFETVVAPGYTLRKMSARAYVTDARFEMLSCAIAVGTGPVLFFHQLGAAGGALEDARALLAEQAAAGATLVCHNAGFDGLILKLRWNLEFKTIFDTSGYAAYLGLARSLENLARHLGLQKGDHPPFEAAALRDPSALAQLARYNALDVAVCRRAFVTAITDMAFTDAEFQVVDLTARRNLEGLLVDAVRATALAGELARLRESVLEQLAAEFDFDTTNLQSVPKVKAYLRRTFGVSLASLRHDDLDLLRLAAADRKLERFLALRRRFSALARRARQLLEYAELGGRVFSFLKYFGAHTGRFAGGGLSSDRLNIQNLPKKRNSSGVPELGKIRSILVPAEGMSFCSADLASIEARVIAWLAGEEALLRRFAAGDDVYIWFAGLVFQGTVIGKDGPNAHLRKLAKEAVLGLGFGMGFAKFLDRVRKADPTVNEQVVKQIFDDYRGRFPAIAELRKACWRAFRTAVDRGVVDVVGRCRFIPRAGPEGTTVSVELPTGRTLFYRAVEVVEGVMPWGDMGKTYWYAEDFEVRPGAIRRGRARAGRTRRSHDGRLRVELNPQTIIENVVQAIARDLLVHQMLDVEQRGLVRPVFHVHDELVVECDRCSCGTPAHDAGCPWIAAGVELTETMSRVPASLPGLAGLPVGCELSKEVRDGYGE